MSAHEVILASAGTGKTWQLSGRFLQRLAQEVPPERILATTFTRKAAAQILDRVLGRLLEAVQDEGARDALRVGPDAPAPDREACLELLARLARRIDRFDVRTLDSFFVELAKVFALELGLPAGWSIASPVDELALRAEAVGRLLEEVPPRELIQLLRALDRDQARRSVHGTLMDVVKAGHAAWLDAEPAAWEVVTPPAALSADELAAAGRALQDFETPKTKADKPRKNWQSNLDGARAALAGEDWEALLDVSVVKRVINGAPEFDREPITDEIRAVFEPLIRHAAHFVLGQLARHALNMRDLISRYDRVFRGLQRERRSYRFEDLPRALLGTSWHGVRGAFRRDSPIDHLLLDEFQDTSALQWRVLSGQAESILEDDTGARSLFCVGDVKQSIYGWRSGEPRLLAGLAADHPQMQVTLLHESWRSGRAVLDAVNRVFTGLQDNAMLADDAVLVDAARAWQLGFDQHTAHHDRPAAARLLQVPTEADTVGVRAADVVKAAARHVAMLHAEAPQATIGVLFRRGKHLPLMLRALRDAGVMASGEGGNPLTDSAVVCAALSWLTLVDHPAHGLARYHVATSVLAEAVGLTDPGDEQGARERAADWRRDLLRDGYGAMLATLGDAVRAAPDLDGWEQDRFGQLVDLAHAWDARANLRPADFVRYARATSVEDPRAAPVKVITVHRAKGLEFDAVVLPDLDAALAGRPDDLLTERPDPKARYTAVCPAVRKDLLPLSPRLQELADGMRSRRVQEELCVLYVAMTRAKHRLDMLVETPGLRSPKKSFSTLLRAAFATAGQASKDPVGELDVLWAHEENADDWAPDAPVIEGAIAPGADDSVRIKLKQSEGVRLRPRKSPSSREGGGGVSASEVLALHDGRGAARGSVIHAWLAEIRWFEQGVPDEERLAEIARELSRRDELHVTEAELGDWGKQLHAMLEQTTLRGVLARPDGEGWDVWRERGFAVVLEEDGVDTLVQGAFDRVLIERRDGRVVSAVVVDYKSDRLDTPRGDADALALHYRPQMDAYRRALAALTGLPADDIACRLLFLEVDELREV